MRLSSFLRFTVLGLGLFVASPLLAQKKKADPAAEEVNLDEEKSASDDAAEESEKKEGESDEAKEEGEGEKEGEGDRPVEPEDDRTKTSPVEHKGETYRFVGLRYRLLLIPTFIMEMFGEGGETVPVHNFGPEFTIRKDAFEYSFAVTYAPYSMGEGPDSDDQVAFKNPNDPEEAWEVVTSELKVLYLTADFNWSTPISQQVSFTYGGGAGIGFVFGNLYRTQAYLDDDGTYKPCDAPGVPAVPVAGGGGAQYCDIDPEHGDDQHYDGYTEPSWADGGSKPIIFPWIALQVGLRYKPHRNFVTRFEAGVGLGQFFFGIGADYGL
jgi:hypothetical protein